MNITIPTQVCEKIITGTTQISLSAFAPVLFVILVFEIIAFIFAPIEMRFRYFTQINIFFIAITGITLILSMIL